MTHHQGTQLVETTLRALALVRPEDESSFMQDAGFRARVLDELRGAASRHGEFVALFGSNEAFLALCSPEGNVQATEGASWQ